MAGLWVAGPAFGFQKKIAFFIAGGLAGQQATKIEKFMAKHLDTGKLGEEAARRFLEQKGFQILETNWRHGHLEVDIIARDGDVLVFVEVKTRGSTWFGAPEEFVDKRKEKLLARAAAAYMEAIGHEWAIRFDVVSVVVGRKGQLQVRHVRDAFFPGLDT